MNLLLTAEQQLVLDTLAGVAKDSFPLSRLHGGSAAGDRASFARLAEMGWFGLGLDEALGGVGYGAVEDLLLFRECGRQLVSPTVLAMRLGAEVAARAGQRALAEEIIAGRSVVAMGRARWATRLFPTGQGHVQTGESEQATLILVWNRDGAALFAAPALAGDHVVSPIDKSLGLRSAAIDGLEPLVWCAAATAPLPWLGRLYVAAMAVGIAEAARDQAVAHAEVRTQFGKPIGSFQAVQHRCADMAVAAEVAWAQCLVAALSLAERADDADQQIVAAAMLAIEAAIGNARNDIQVHGGMGYSAECDAHLYLKRAHYLSRLALVPGSDAEILSGGERASKSERVERNAA